MFNARYILILMVVILGSCHKANYRENQKESMSTETIPGIVTADIEEGIKKHIDEQVLKGDGYFHLNAEGKNLQLRLVRVHTEYLANLGPQRHFACVDLADISGDVYDVDFFMEGDPGDISVTETTLHKLNGRPYYTWSQKEDDTWFRVPVEESSSKLMGVIEGIDQFTFQYTITLPEFSENGELWIPLATSDRFQTVKLLSLESPVAHQVIQDKKFGNSILYMKLDPTESGKNIDLIYEVQRIEKNPYEDDSSPFDHLDPSMLMPVNDRFRTLADSIIADNRNESTLMQARDLYDYLIDNMRYMKFGDYGKGDAVYACDALSGNCSEFHSFFISLARSAGIPARFAIGAAIPSERDEGGISGYHCWAEFYSEGKWWPIDISEANKYDALSTYYFGRHPANRIEFSRGRDLIIEPGPKSGPVNFLAYPVFETGGHSIPTKTFFQFKRKTNKRGT